MVNDISQLIEQFGFPIFACIALFWILLKILKESREDRLDTIERHYKERAEWYAKHTDDVNDLVDDRREITKALQSLSSKIADQNGKT